MLENMPLTELFRIMDTPQFDELLALEPEDLQKTLTDLKRWRQDPEEAMGPENPINELLGMLENEDIVCGHCKREDGHAVLETVKLIFKGFADAAAKRHFIMLALNYDNAVQFPRGQGMPVAETRDSLASFKKCWDGLPDYTKRLLNEQLTGGVRCEARMAHFKDTGKDLGESVNIENAIRWATDTVKKVDEAKKEIRAGQLARGSRGPYGYQKPNPTLMLMYGLQDLIVNWLGRSKAHILPIARVFAEWQSYEEPSPGWGDTEFRSLKRHSDERHSDGGPNKDWARENFPIWLSLNPANDGTLHQ